MSYMFHRASSFNQPLRWDTSNVIDMSCLFSDASSFNQPLRWDTSNVTNMVYMFYKATLFNQSLKNWVFHSDAKTYLMLGEAAAYDQELPDALDPKEVFGRV